MMSHTSYSGKRFEMFLQNVHKTDYDIKRALMTPDELMRLPSDSAIIMKTGLAPILGQKLSYYTDNTMLTRSNMSSINQNYKYTECVWNVHRNIPKKTIEVNKLSETDILI